jgi:hypothetical protein
MSGRQSTSEVVAFPNSETDALESELTPNFGDERGQAAAI